MKEEPQDAKTPPVGDGGAAARRSGGKQNNRHRWNNTHGSGATGTPTAKFSTRSKDLPDHVVFDNTGQVDAANFQRALKGMANFLHTTYSAEVGDAILKMQPVIIAVEDSPPQRVDASGIPIPLSSWEEYKWKKTYAEQSNRFKTYTYLQSMLHQPQERTRDHDHVLLHQRCQRPHRSSQTYPGPLLLVRLQDPECHGDGRFSKKNIYLLPTRRHG